MWRVALLLLTEGPAKPGGGSYQTGNTYEEKCFRPGNFVDCHRLSQFGFSALFLFVKVLRVLIVVSCSFGKSEMFLVSLSLSLSELHSSLMFEHYVASFFEFDTSMILTTL